MAKLQGVGTFTQGDQYRRDWASPSPLKTCDIRKSRSIIDQVNMAYRREGSIE